MVGAASVASPVVLSLVAGIFGLVLGSFVTALSYRLPRGISIAKGRSACPSCGFTLTPVDLIPVVSYLVQGGACRACGAKISWRYPAIELTVAVLFVAATLRLGLQPRLLLVLAATPAMVALSVIDLEHRRLPNGLLTYFAAVAIAFRYLIEPNLWLALASAVAVACCAAVLSWLGRRLAGQRLGMGDTKLMIALAIGLPPVPLLLVLGVGAVIGLLQALAIRVSGGKSVREVPIGPSFLAAAWIAWVSI